MDEFQKDVAAVLANMQGANMVLREVLIALFHAHPNGAAVLAAALASAQGLRDGLVNTAQPDALLVGIDLEHRLFSKQLAKMRRPGG